MAIRSFKCTDTRDLFAGRRIRRFIGIESSAMRKLAILNRAANLDDLRVPPGNRLESLKGNRTGQFSIRINDQYRLCFVWTSEGAADVEIADYH
ncbi:MAG TPA: type II toxin-antitoxin system RelE/ParE family toxin [Candidatus Hydrogenedentes bacterium]|nr:type II toxin-antitoxin system RelE/ParE family toxin [Candidatus Hydrogenedentota bacterium]